MSKENQKYAAVIDSSCTEEYPEREHTIIVNGVEKPVIFKFGEKTILPYHEALKFSDKDGFTVQDVDGNSLDLPPNPNEFIKQKLAKDECVAKYAELKFDALKIRVSQKNGGEIYADAGEGDVDNLVAFLSGALPVGSETGFIDGEDNLLEEDEDEAEAYIDGIVNKITSDVDERKQKILDHFAADLHHAALVKVGNHIDDTIIFAVYAAVNEGQEPSEVVRGTFLELEEATVLGLSVEDYNVPADVVEPEEGEANDEAPATAVQDLTGAADSTPEEPNSPDGENGADPAPTEETSTTTEPTSESEADISTSNDAESTSEEGNEAQSGDTPQEDTGSETETTAEDKAA